MYLPKQTISVVRKYHAPLVNSGRIIPAIECCPGNQVCSGECFQGTCMFGKCE